MNYEKTITEYQEDKNELQATRNGCIIHNMVRYEQRRKREAVLLSITVILYFILGIIVGSL